MSEEERPLEFSARDLMPDWAQEKPREPQKDLVKRFGDDDDRRERRGGGRQGDRRDDRGGFGGRGERRGPGGGGGGGGRFDRDRPRDDRPRGDGPRGDRPRGDRPRQEGGRDDRRGGDRREGGGRREGGRPARDFRDRRDGPREEPAPTGITAAIEPSGPAIEGLTRHIRDTFRSFALADLAKMILEARERYRIRFTAADPVKLYQCLADASLWLSREEAIQHVLSGPALEHFYTAEDVSVDPPAGNFSVIAVCGLSGVILGPPNHHEYQRNIARLHRERFADMSIDRYKSRIRMESGEEIIEKWKEQVSRVRQYRVKSPDQPSLVEPVAEEPVVEETAAPAEETVTGAEAPALEGDLDSAAEAPDEAVETAEAVEGGEEASEEPVEEAPAPVAKKEEGLVLKSIEEVARHFRQHFADDSVIETSIAVVPGNVPGRQLSPGLLSHLRQETEKLRRGFPLALMQSLCHEFEQKGLKFFKRGKKSLHVSAVRPKAIDEGAIFSEQIQRIVDFVAATARPTVASLLEALVPGFEMPKGPLPEENPDLSESAKSLLGDLRWLTSEGYVLEFPDTSLAIGRPKQEAPVPAAPAVEKPKREKKEKQERAPRSEAAAAAAAVVSASSPVTDSPVEEAADAFPPDALVALSGEEADPEDPYELPDGVDPVETF